MTSTLPHTVLGDGPTTVVFAHGFTQTRTSWMPVAQRLIAHTPAVRCVLVDLPGHGQSHDVEADVAATARLLVATGRSAHYIGYSLGARAVLQAMVQHPDVVKSVVSLSGTAGIEDSTERNDRRNADEERARHLLEIGVEAFVDEWLAQPLFADLPRAQAQVSERQTNTALGLASSLRLCGQGATTPMWDSLAHCTTPVLAMAGTRDTKFVALARRIAALSTTGRLALIADAGHSAHLEQPDAVAQEIGYWIANPTEYNTPITS